MQRRVPIASARGIQPQRQRANAEEEITLVVFQAEEVIATATAGIDHDAQPEQDAGASHGRLLDQLPADPNR